MGRNVIILAMVVTLGASSGCEWQVQLSPEDANTLAGLEDMQSVLGKDMIFLRDQYRAFELQIRAVLQDVSDGKMPVATGAALIESYTEQKEDIAKAIANLEVKGKEIAADIKLLKDRGLPKWLIWLGAATGLIGTVGTVGGVGWAIKLARILAGARRVITTISRAADASGENGEAPPKFKEYVNKAAMKGEVNGALVRSYHHVAKNGG